MSSSVAAPEAATKRTHAEAELDSQQAGDAQPPTKIPATEATKDEPAVNGSVQKSGDSGSSAPTASGDSASPASNQKEAEKMEVDEKKSEEPKKDEEKKSPAKDEQVKSVTVEAESVKDDTDKALKSDLGEGKECPTSESKKDTIPDSKSDEKKNEKSDVSTEKIPEAKPESKPEEKPENKPEDKPESKPEEKPEGKPEDKPENKPVNKDGETAENKAKTEEKQESKSEVKTEGKAAEKSEKKAELATNSEETKVEAPKPESAVKTDVKSQDNSEIPKKPVNIVSPYAVDKDKSTKDSPSVKEEKKSTPAKDASKSQPSSSSKKVDKPAKKDDGEKKSAKSSQSTPKGANKTPEQVLEYMDKTFSKRRAYVTNDIPTIPQLKEKYPDLFMGKQLLMEFQRITKIDIDQKIQEFCVRYATAVIEMAREKKGSEVALARWETARQENEALKQYWDMVTALCLLPLHFGENFQEMVIEIGEEDPVMPQGKIVPVLVARGNIYRTDEFFLIAENTVVQEFEEFTIAFASLYSAYWVFNMVYPQTVDNTYNYIQRCIVRQREPGLVPQVCKNFTKALQKWNKGKENK